MDLISTFYIVSIASIIVLTVLLSFVLVYALFILRDVNKITATTKETADHINTFVMKPVFFTKEILHYVKPFLSMVEERNTRKRKSKSE